jgi:hypothetical protein
MRFSSILVGAVVLVGAACNPHSPDQNPLDSEQGGYEFVEDTDRWVAMIQGKTQSIGKLDREGNFIADALFVQLERQDKPRSTDPDYLLLNAPAQEGVYEFRSGRLILGDLDEDGNFVPRPARSVVDFKDYHYSSKAPKIYNLPGKFVPKKNEHDKK